MRRSILLLLLLFCACRRGAAPGYAGDALGEGGADDTLWKADGAALRDPATLQVGMDLVRAELWGDPPPDAAALASEPGRRAFACLYGLERVAICGTGVGTDLAASLRTAARDLKDRLGPRLDPAKRASTPLKVEVVTRVEAGVWKEKYEKIGDADIGRWGLWVGSGSERSFVLPSEILERDLWSDKKGKKGLDRAATTKVLAQRNPQLPSLASPFDYERIKTVAWVEQSQPREAGSPVFELYRIHDKAFPPINAASLLQRSVWAADYLISSVRPDGHIRYEYLVGKDKDTSDYNILRHAGTTYSILQAYERTKFPPYLDASKKAIEYYFSFTREDERTGPWGGGKTRWAHSPKEGGRIKLGGVGLGLVMLSQYAEGTGDKTTYLEQARGFGRFLVSQQKKDGEFFYFAALEVGKPFENEYSAYYPGEAILGLVRLYGWDPDPLWLATAERGANWLIDVRDKGKPDKNLENDHWLMIALSYLHAATGKDAYLQHSLRLARATQATQDKNKETASKYIDWTGGYYKPPRSTPAAVRAEGLTAVLDTCLQAKEDCAWVREVLEKTVQHIMWSQYTPDTMYWVPNQAKTFGGINGGLVDTSIRNDFVQHAMSGILGLERKVRADAGETVPGGPGWSKRAVQGESYPGLTADAVAELRRETLRHRGPSSWEGGAAGPEAPESAPDDNGEERED